MGVFRGALGLIFCTEMHNGQMRQTSPTKMKKEIVIDQRVFAALVSMLARETLSLESPFPKLRKLVPIRMQSSTASEAACASDSENLHELDSENVNAARVIFSIQMCFAT